MKNNCNLNGKVLLFLLLAVAGMAKAQQWKEFQTGITEDLYDVCCIDTSNVLACGPNGLVVKTMDGGQTWEQKNSHTESTLYLIKFVNDNIGFACGDDTFLKTVDGGDTWIKMETDPEIGFNYSYSYMGQTNLFIVDADIVYITDSYNKLWKSIDGGEYFEKVLDLQDTMEEFYRFDLYFEGNVGYLIGYDHTSWIFPTGLAVLKTMDYGKTWETIEITECESMLSAVHFTDKDHIRFYGYFDTAPDEYYGILETSDGMETYSLQQPTELWAGLPDPWGLGRYITFSSENHGCLVYNLLPVKEQSDFCSYAFLTQDDGETWTSAPEGINWRNYLFAVDGVDTVFYIAASDGYVYKTGTADVIYPYSLEERESALKVFPNPAIESITVTIPSSFDVLDSDLSTIELSTILGQVVMRNSFRGNSTILDINGLPKGLYLLNLRNGKLSFVEKIMKQ